MRDIADQTHIPKTTIREALKKSGKALRDFSTGKNVPKESHNGKRSGHTPYGFTYFDGAMVVDPKEHLIVRKIIKLRQEGMSFCAIASLLNRQNVRTRNSKIWRRSVIRNIVLRHKG